MNYPRKRPQGQNNNNHNHNNNNQRRRNGGGGGSGGGNNNNRPRKNYTALREKYLQQARDALAMGDRVLAENYYQHADHCFRMIAEELASRPPRPQPQPRPQNQDGEPTDATVVEAGENAEGTDTATEETAEVEDSADMNVSSLPAFLTANYTPPKVEGQQPTPPAQNWEEE